MDCVVDIGTTGMMSSASCACDLRGRRPQSS